MKRLSLLVMAAVLLGVSCERHEFDGPNGTRQLHEHHGGPGATGDHGDKDAGH
jgi:hypothetical protein